MGTNSTSSTETQARTADPVRANRLRRARAVFTCACDMPPAERSAFVADACGDDAALIELVRSLLAADEEHAAVWDCSGVEVAAAPVLAMPSGYEPVRELGRGGIGVVHLCRQRDNGELVAVKLVHLASVGRSGANRFERECRILSKLRHPSLVPLRAAGQLDGGTAYLVMDYVDGRDIRSFCREHRVSVRHRLEMLVSVAEALSVAHAYGIVHRDIKPGNILVDASRRARLIDFGAARVTAGEMRSRHEHTLTGQIVGTLSYLSPEQADGRSRHADSRSDLYQLGVVAYELLANRMPYDISGQTSAETLRTIIVDRPTAASAAAGLPAGHPADAFFDRALAKDPQSRFASAKEMAVALADLAQRFSGPSSRSARSAARRPQAER